MRRYRVNSVANVLSFHLGLQNLMKDKVAFERILIYTWQWAIFNSFLRGVIDTRSYLPITKMNLMTRFSILSIFSWKWHLRFFVNFEKSIQFFFNLLWNISSKLLHSKNFTNRSVEKKIGTLVLKSIKQFLKLIYKSIHKNLKEACLRYENNLGTEFLQKLFIYLFRFY